MVTRSGPSGSARAPPSSSRPWAVRVAFAGTGGRRSATTSSAPNTSSGRTAGVVCRTTAVSIAQTSTSPVTVAGEPLPASPARAPGRRARRSAAARTASPARRRRTRARAGRRAPPQRVRGDAGQLDPPAARVDAVGQRGPPAAAAAASTSRPSGRAASSARATAAGSTISVSPISTYSASLAAPVGARPDPGQPRVRAEAVRVRHRQPRPADGALEAAGDVAVGEEAQPPALGEPQPDARHGGRSGVGGLPRPHASHPANPRSAGPSPAATRPPARNRRAGRRPCCLRSGRAAGGGSGARGRARPPR